MLLDKIVGKKETTNIIGMLYGQKGEELVVEEITPGQSRRLSKMYEKINDSPEKKIMITQNGALVEPYQIVHIPLDLTKSSDRTNENLLDYLKYGSLINQLIQNSTVDTTSVLRIMETEQYRNEFTYSYLAVYQNIFLSDKCISLFPFVERLRFYTKNIHRTQEIMAERRDEFFAIIEQLLQNYADGTDNLAEENPSDIRVDIINTCNTYYSKDISFSDIKKKIVDIPKQRLLSLEQDIEALQRTEELISKYQKRQNVQMEKKEWCVRALELNHEQQNDIKNRITKNNKMIEVIKNFPL